MTGYGPLLPVDGPRPAPPRFGLIQAATVVNEPDDRWINGVAVRQWPPGLPGGYDPCPTSTNPNVKAAGGAVGIGEFGALTVYLAETCTTRGIITDEDFRSRALVSFAAREGYRVEHEFWTGAVLPDTPHLADTNASVLNAGVSTSPLNGLALLEGAIAASGTAGVIHAPAQIVSVWSAAYQVFIEGPRLITALGTVVIPGFGYDGSAPSGHTAASGTKQYAFATGPVEIRRSNVFLNPDNLAQATDRSVNSVSYYAERYYVTTWDGVLQAAVLIDRCATTC